MTLTPWLRVMLEEIERKQKDAAVAQTEAMQRTPAGSPARPASARQGG